jgi:hypothetical protein
MAITYAWTFDLKLTACKLSVKKTFDDGLRTPDTTAVDVAAKIAMALSSANDNTSLTGADCGVAAIYDVAASGTTTIDLQALVDLAERAAQSLVRVKFAAFMLLPVAKGGTACSGVTLGNAATNANTLWMGATAHTTPLENGDWILWGKGTAAGKVVDATHKLILATCTDAVVAAKLLAVIVGGTD